MLTPEGLVGTCTLGKPTMYDYVVHSSFLEGCLELQGDLESTTSPHVSLRLGINRRPRSISALRIWRPKEFPIVELYKQEEKQKE